MYLDSTSGYSNDYFGGMAPCVVLTKYEYNTILVRISAADRLYSLPGSLRVRFAETLLRKSILHSISYMHRVLTTTKVWTAASSGLLKLNFSS